MGSIWTYKFNGNTIVVKNEKETALYVNDQLQDKQEGISLTAHLSGKLPSGEEVKATIGGVFNVKCNLFIDNVLQEPADIQ